MSFSFGFDPAKSASNQAKHGLDFVEAQKLWADDRRLNLPADSSVEPRFAIVARMGEHHWFSVYTLRGSNIRLITVRRAREKEAEAYDNQPG